MAERAADECPPGSGPGIQSEAIPARAAPHPPQGRQGGAATGSGGQGGHIRLGGHIDQAIQTHGRDEGGHGRGCMCGGHCFGGSCLFAVLQPI